MTEAGLWLYDAQGRQVSGPGTSNVTVLGVVDTGKVNGSVSHPGFALGRPCIVMARATEGVTTWPPRITISGTTISWSYEVSGANLNQPFRIIYGVRS
nr:hypothetical protein [Brevundimonas naejangsanensis]